jgi:hypothetical protein
MAIAVTFTNSNVLELPPHYTITNYEMKNYKTVNYHMFTIPLRRGLGG